MARQVVVEIIGDSKKFTRSLDEATNKSSKFGSVLQGVGLSIGTGLMGLASTGVQMLVDGIGDAVQNASELQQSAGAIESVFGKASKKIEAFGKQAATSVGLSQREVQEMAAVMGAGLQSMGFSADEAADKTITLEKRAADMAATFGGSTKDAVEAITSLMRGERDPIEKFGVSIKQADVNARVLALGLDTSTDAAKKNAEAVATMDLLMEQTSNTQGQFAKESDSLAGSQAIMNAKMENISATIGEKLMPIFAAVTTFISDKVLPIVMDLVDWFGQIWEAAEPVVAGIITELQPAFNEIVKVVKQVIDVIAKHLPPVFDLIKNNIKISVAVIRTLIEIFTNISKVTIPIFSKAVEILVGVITGGFNLAKTIVGGVIDHIVRSFNNVVNFFKTVGPTIGNAVSGMWNGIWTGFKGVLNLIIKAWNGLKFTVPKISTPFGDFGGFTLGTPNIPYLHAGGVVPGTPGSDVLSILQAGEVVIPRNQVSQGSTEVHIHIEQGAFIDGPSVDRLANMITKRLRYAPAT